MIYKFWISSNHVVIVRAGDVTEHGISLQVFWQNVKEKCTFKNIYGVGKIKFQTKLSGRIEKNTNLVENLKEIN